MKTMVMLAGLLLTLVMSFLCSHIEGSPLQNQKQAFQDIPVLARHRRDNNVVTTFAPNTAAKRPPWQQGSRTTRPPGQLFFTGKPYETINITGLTEVEIEKLTGNLKNNSDLDSNGFPKRFNRTRGTVSPNHDLRLNASEWRPKTSDLKNKIGGNSKAEHKTHASMKGKKNNLEKNVNENKDNNELPREKENKPEGWKSRYADIVVGVVCGMALVTILIVLLHWHRMRKRGKIEVAVS